MELFIKVYFWISLVGIVLRVFLVGYADYPRKTSRGSDAVCLLLSIPFLAWAAYLVWG
jgi:hypothetical protein